LSFTSRKIFLKVQIRSCALPFSEGLPGADDFPASDILFPALSSSDGTITNLPQVMSTLSSSERDNLLERILRAMADLFDGIKEK